MAFPSRTGRLSSNSLSETQQLAIAREVRGDEGEQILDRAWRTPGVRDLIAVPLYLTAVLGDRSKGALPTTKEEILKLIVDQHQAQADRLEALRRVLGEFHNEYLQALAVEGVARGTTSIAVVDARKVIVGAAARLIEAKQIAQVPEPNDVLVALVNHHTLVRTDDGDSASVDFQHQQIQEWFASFEVERLMLASVGGNTAARRHLRTEVIDKQPWEESILFACERLCRNGSADAVAALVQETLTVDPMLAAEVIYRSTAAVWHIAKAPVMSLVERWHVPGRVDRAVRFLVASGRPEFAEQVWSLLSDKNQNVYLRTTRVARRFRPAVLGVDAPQKLAELPIEQRGAVASEMITNGGMEGIEFSTGFARGEGDPAVIAEIIEALHFRRADRQVKELLGSAVDAVWERLSQRGYGAELAGAEAAKRLASEREKRWEAEPNKLREISTLVHGDLGSSTLQAITTAIESPEVDFSVKNRDTGENSNATIREAYRRAPGAVAAGLLMRIETGLSLPFRCEELIDSAPVIDHGPLVALVLDKNTEPTRAVAAARTVGPKTVSELTRQLIEVHSRLDRSSPKELRDEFHRLHDLVKSTRPEPFLQALLELGDAKEPARIALLAGLFAGHGRDFERGRLGARAEDVERFKDKLLEWIEVVLADPTSTRHQYGELAQAAARLVVLRHEFCRRFRPAIGVAQQGHRGKPRAMPTMSWRRMLAMELATWRSGRNGGVSGSPTLGNGRLRERDLATPWGGIAPLSEIRKP